MTAEAPKLQDTLQTTYNFYQDLDKEYRKNVEDHNTNRKSLHEQM